MRECKAEDVEASAPSVPHACMHAHCRSVVHALISRWEPAYATEVALAKARMSAASSMLL